ncbi:hypothetical protein ELE36_13070 [Pseudolysobacter antarcticus]|uniref:Uncharacterized protein n=1 Tax=Pseudolysobacter antarcticus TaxID=2511995 RepID=A0A411HL04_9GAMM|nr:hypothetical protein [Pseudolysobacter antarcticus]QBB71209.1 hypothetical protein ELE36_13070 [Pseudolysobacter antarcticus]
MTARILLVLSLSGFFFASNAAHCATATLTVDTAASAVIAAAKGTEKITITINAGHVEIITTSVKLIGDKIGDKRYYHRGPGGPALVEVKSESAGFKLRAPDSKLLWKIKIGDDKIKVSDNEQNANAWAIKTDHADKAKIVDPAERPIGEVKFSKETGKTKLKDGDDVEQFVIEAGKFSAAYGVLLMSGIPRESALVIVAELMARGH